VRCARAALCAAWALAALLPGCGSAEQAPAAEPAAVATTGFHTRYGFPGPWSREGASHVEFDADSRACLESSNEARRSVAGDRNDAAYRSFLECMEERGWTRGVAPRADRAAAAAPGRES
jgi:hypothetical protein